MAKRPTSSSKIISFVLTIAFVLLAALVGYATWKGGVFELRSKAAQQAIDYKRWDFDKDTNGWLGSNLRSLTSKSGRLIAAIGKTQGNIFTDAINILLPAGSKSIDIRLAVVPSGGQLVLGEQQICYMTLSGKRLCVNAGEEVGNPNKQSGTPKPISTGKQPCVLRPTCPAGMMCAQTQQAPLGGWCPPVKEFTMSVSYWTKGEVTGKPPKSAPLLIRGVADGRMREYSLKISSIKALTITKIRVGFVSGINMGDQVEIDWMKLAGLVAKRVPTPTAGAGTTARVEREGVLSIENAGGVPGENGRQLMIARINYVLTTKDGQYIMVIQPGRNPETMDTDTGKGVVGAKIPSGDMLNFDQYVGCQVSVTGTMQTQQNEKRPMITVSSMKAIGVCKR